MKFSRVAKAGLAVAALIGFVLFLIVVDLGVNAGRIHYGVSVAGENIGGMTRREAREPVAERGKEIKNMVIRLLAPGLNDGIQPKCLGWKKDVRGTIRGAYDVGRDDAPFGALSDRVAAWLWGVKVEFVGTEPTALDAHMDAWDETLSALGEPLDRDALAELLDEAIAEGNPGPFEFPRSSATAEATARSQPAARDQTAQDDSNIPVSCDPPENPTALEPQQDS